MQRKIGKTSFGKCYLSIKKHQIAHWSEARTHAQWSFNRAL